jgi:hypothetical protein
MSRRFFEGLGRLLTPHRDAAPDLKRCASAAVSMAPM